MSIDLTMRSVRNTAISAPYVSLMTGKELSEGEQQALLSAAVVFLNSTDRNVEKLGYRIVLSYSNRYKNYQPLYDVSINKDYIPITKFIEQQLLEEADSSFMRTFLSSYGEGFRKNDIYLTSQQFHLKQSFSALMPDQSVAVVAPTSYGKSELIIESLGKAKGHVCILVPTKALIAQTKKKILNSGKFALERQILTHPEMYSPRDQSITAVMTQERLLRLLKKVPSLKFTQVFVDEAHNLLENDERSRLLASAIIILRSRNQQTSFRYLTPFLLDHTNLETAHSDFETAEFKVDEYIKSEKYFCYASKSGNVRFYDHFLNAFYDLGEHYKDDITLILKKQGTKNILYVNNPADTEHLALRISAQVTVPPSPAVLRACNALMAYVHKDYFLVDCLRRGTAYHHGSVPDIIKLYLEHLYSSCNDIKFLATTSTLLEGVNIPADKMFILDCKKGRRNLSPSQFSNLTGRVCRFNEIFDPTRGSLTLLEPDVYLVASEYMGNRANVEKFLEGAAKVDKKISEKPENVLLAKAELNALTLKQKKSAEEFIENFEPGTIEKRSLRRATTALGRSCFANSLTEIDIFADELSCQQRLTRALKKYGKIQSENLLLEVINEVFLPSVTESKLRRLAEAPARAFYAMFLRWRIENISLGEMISSFIAYWEKLEKEDPLVYVGSKWGDTKRDRGFVPLWTDIRKKTHRQRVNLAIVRIKEEQDFLDNNVMKFVEVLNELGAVNDELYNGIQFGTSDPQKILLMKTGLSSALAGLLLSRYKDSISVDLRAGEVRIDPKVRANLVTNDENEILIFEFDCNVPRVAQ